LQLQPNDGKIDPVKLHDVALKPVQTDLLEAQALAALTGRTAPTVACTGGSKYTDGSDVKNVVMASKALSVLVPKSVLDQSTAYSGAASVNGMVELRCSPADAPVASVPALSNTTVA
jgi:hypothetical protein